MWAKLDMRILQRLALNIMSSVNCLRIYLQIFRSMSRGFLLLSPVSLTELCSFWYGLTDLFTLHLSLTVKTDDVTKDRKDLDPHRWLRAVQGRMG